MTDAILIERAGAHDAPAHLFSRVEPMHRRLIAALAMALATAVPASAMDVQFSAPPPVHDCCLRPSRSPARQRSRAMRRKELHPVWQAKWRTGHEDDGHCDRWGLSILLSLL